MYNPFPLISLPLLKEKIQSGKKYFVRQTYSRGYRPGLVAAFLLRGYEAGEKELAEMHMAALSTDGNAFLYDAFVPAHLHKLEIAARQPMGYNIFYAGKKGLIWKPPLKYKDKMKQYISNTHPGWRTKRGGDKIEIGLYEEFGRLFLKFSFGKEEDKIALEEIEK